MIWLLTIPVIFAFTFRDLYYSGFPDLPGDARTFLSWAFMFFTGTLISGLISLAPLGIAVVIGSSAERVDIPGTVYPLVSLREKDGIRGQSYFLGAGSVNDVQYYFWYRKNTDGSISGGKTIRSQGVRIYQGESTPRMVTFETDYVSEWSRRYLWIVGMDPRADEDWCPDFYIPPGSIKDGFEL